MRTRKQSRRVSGQSEREKSKNIIAKFGEIVSNVAAGIIFIWVMGLTGFEPVTARLWAGRSNLTKLSMYPPILIFSSIDFCFSILCKDFGINTWVYPSFVIIKYFLQYLKNVALSLSHMVIRISEISGQSSNISEFLELTLKIEENGNIMKENGGIWKPV